MMSPSRIRPRPVWLSCFDPTPRPDSASHRTDAVLSIKPEDLNIVGPSNIDVPVHAFENISESVLINGQFGDRRITAKGDRYLRKSIDEQVGMRLDRQHLYMFDQRSEERVWF